MPDKLVIRNVSSRINRSETETTQSADPSTSSSPVDEEKQISDNRPLATTSDPMQKKQKTMITYAVTAALMLLLGTGTGYAVQKGMVVTDNTDNKLSSGEEIQAIAGDTVHVGDIFGSADEQAFKDNTEGYLEAGGVNGEGTHKLLRVGGDIKTVSLTSSVTDLSKLEGMEVRVWGQTNKSQTAGWFMDVGRIEILKTESTPPTE